MFDKRDTMVYFNWACYIIVPYLVQKTIVLEKKNAKATKFLYYEIITT